MNLLVYLEYMNFVLFNLDT